MNSDKEHPITKISYEKPTAVDLGPTAPIVGASCVPGDDVDNGDCVPVGNSAADACKGVGNSAGFQPIPCLVNGNFPAFTPA
jgi:hypothetical protein